VFDSLEPPSLVEGVDVPEDTLVVKPESGFTQPKEHNWLAMLWSFGMISTGFLIQMSARRAVVKIAEWKRGELELEQSSV
jgi:hypothetical protein